MKFQARSFIFGTLRFGVGIGLLVFLVTSGAVDWQGLLGLLYAWPITLLAFAVILIDIIITSWRLSLLMKPHGLTLSLWASTRMSFIGTFFNFCLPGATGGDLMRMYYAMEGNAGRRMELGTIILFDRVVGAYAMILLPILLIPFFPTLIWSLPQLQNMLWVATFFVVSIGLGAVFLTPLFIRSVRVRDLLRFVPLNQYLLRIIETVYGYRHYRKTVIAAIGISLLAHSLSIVVMLILAEAIMVDGSAWEMCVLIPFGLVANTLPLTPGGIGVGEAAFESLFGLAGLSGGAEIMLGWRLLTLFSGFVGLVFYLQGRRQHVHQA